MSRWRLSLHIRKHRELMKSTNFVEMIGQMDRFEWFLIYVILAQRIDTLISDVILPYLKRHVKREHQ